MNFWIGEWRYTEEVIQTGSSVLVNVAVSSRAFNYTCFWLLMKMKKKKHWNEEAKFVRPRNQNECYLQVRSFTKYSKVSSRKEWPAGFGKEKSSWIVKWRKLLEERTLLPTVNLEQQGKELGMGYGTRERKGNN